MPMYILEQFVLFNVDRTLFCRLCGNDLSAPKAGQALSDSISCMTSLRTLL